MRLLEGDVQDNPDLTFEMVQGLRDEILDLRNQLRVAQQATVLAKREAASALGALRKQLSPLYRALQAVFGELDAAGVEDQTTGPSTSPRVSAVWEAWKQKLSPACGKIIDALLTHSELNSAQLKVACRLGTSTVSDSIYKLNKAGLINKNAGRFSLKSPGLGSC
jgi:hypothetical protein